MSDDVVELTFLTKVSERFLLPRIISGRFNLILRLGGAKNKLLVLLFSYLLEVFVKFELLLDRVQLSTCRVLSALES